MTMEPVLVVVGASSMLAKHFLAQHDASKSLIAEIQREVLLFENQPVSLQEMAQLLKYRQLKVLFCASTFNTRYSHSDDTQFSIEVAMLNSYITWFKEFDVEKIVYVSTGGSLYSDTNVFPVDENGDTLTRSAYNRAKLLGETYFRENFGEQACSVRISNIFGSPFHRSNTIGFIDILLKSDLQAHFKEPKINTYKDWIHCDEVVRCVSSLLQTERTLPPVANLGTGSSYSILDIFNSVRNCAFSELVPKLGEYSLATDRLRDIGIAPRDMLRDFLISETAK